MFHTSSVELVAGAVAVAAADGDGSRSLLGSCGGIDEVDDDDGFEDEDADVLVREGSCCRSCSRRRCRPAAAEAAAPPPPARNVAPLITRSRLFLFLRGGGRTS